MVPTSRSRGILAGSPTWALFVVLAAALFAIALGGCAWTATPGAVASGTPANPATKMDKTIDPNYQQCTACITSKEPTPTVGTVAVMDGTQVVRISIVGGYYSPNQFTVKAGMPVRAVFKVDGKPAKGCVSKPTFKSLNKTVTVTQGEQVLDLGVLSPGTYEFSCAMGADVGRIVAE
jgi:uncharacterized cupredoxin-like copper-binding protein